MSKPPFRNPPEPPPMRVGDGVPPTSNVVEWSVLIAFTVLFVCVLCMVAGAK